MDKLAGFINLLNNYGIDPKGSVAVKLFNDAKMYFVETPVGQTPEDTNALMRLRERLTGESLHEQLVRTALCDDFIIECLQAGKKIQAIKELRSMTGCGLREAKDAVEDARVDGYYGYRTN